MPTTEEKYQFVLLAMSAAINELEDTPAVRALGQRLKALNENHTFLTPEMLDAAVTDTLGQP